MIDLSEVVLLGSFLSGCLSYLFAITVAFKRTVEIEQRIASFEMGSYAPSKTSGGGPTGRWIRIFNVVMLLVFKNTPWFGPSYNEFLDRGLDPIPRHLKLWVLLPIATGHASLIVSFIMGWQLGAYN